MGEEQENEGRENKESEAEKSDFSEIKNSKIVKKVKKNPWMISTAILAIALIALLVLKGGLTGNITGGVINSGDAGQKIIEFAKSRGADATLVEINDKSGLYEVIVLIQGQQVPLYVTKDGKYFSQSIVPLTLSSETETPADIPKSDKPVVELFVMTHCPYGTQAEKGFVPVIELLGDKIDSSIKFVHYFLHEPEETETPIQICIREEQRDKFNDYLACFLEDGDSDRCLKEVGIDETKLNSCIKNKYEDLYATDSALSESYGVRGSPTLVINGQIVESARSPAAYLSTICFAFNDAPEECNEELNSATPSPGFGYTASAGGSTSAQC